MPVLTRLGLAALWLCLAMGLGCYDPALAPCTIRCGSGGACPEELSCNQATGFCLRPGQTCSPAPDAAADGAPDGRSDAPIVDGGVDRPADGPGCTAASCTGGTCYGDACCRGCWDSTQSQCHDGSELDFCGLGGGACAGCNDGNECTRDRCTMGACAHDMFVGNCLNGVCVGGADGGPPRCECGAAAEPCCNGTSCNAGLTCMIGSCGGCGLVGQQCCTGGACAPNAICTGSVMCVACGGANQACCSNQGCGPNLICASGTITCTPCGMSGQPCCAGGACPGPGHLYCNNGTRCDPCGLMNQICCPGNVCYEGLLCGAVSHTCGIL
ncbi:MAG TPA: hypothetical protein VKN99_12125 [Polyangia bacterium]|nr:hypothetical protein [Polyangia bacterium]